MEGLGPPENFFHEFLKKGIFLERFFSLPNPLRVGRKPDTYLYVVDSTDKLSLLWNSVESSE